MLEPHVVQQTFRGLPTGWLESGNPTGPILFCLHGFPDDPTIWDRQAEAFKNDFQILRPFARGISPSEPSSVLSRYSTKAFALDCLSILKQIDATGKRPVVLLGHDLGAAHAWQLAPLLGPRLKGLVIFNGASLPQMAKRLRSSRQILKSWYIFAMQIPWLPETVFRYGAKPMAKITQRLTPLPLHQ